MTRDSLISDLDKHSGKIWDIIIIGGGATGLGIALDAASRGYETLLLEQSDFAKGTSSRSTKLIHGGVRYLAQGDILLVREALHERGLILKNAPHLTFNQEFVIPLYTWWDAFLYSAGLKFYDILAGRLSMGKSHFISRDYTLKRLPLLNPKGLKGGVVYHDGQFDDARMTIDLVKACIRRGGMPLNYFKVTGLLKNETGRINGVLAEEMVSGKNYKIYANLIINATGVFADDIIRMDIPDSKPYIRPSQGVHLVIDSSFLESNSAIMIPKTDDGRVIFAIPWYDKVVVGTTDTPLDKVILEPVALDEEITFILRTAGKYFVKPIRREDVLCVFAGLRPLAANQAKPMATKEISRRHKIISSASGLLTVIGGKWTTYRLMAEETIKKAIKSGILKRKKCITSNLKINGRNPEEPSSRLHIYGDQSVEIEEIIREKPELGERIDPRLPYTRAEIIWIARNEMALTVEDMLARRTRALFLDARASLDIVEEVAGIMNLELRYDEAWVREQSEEYRNLALKYLL